MLNLYTKYPHTSAKTANLTTPSPMLSCWVWQCCTWREAVPHRGTTALRAVVPHLSNRWEAGGYLYFSLSSITSLSSSPTVQTNENQQVLISSLLHWCPSSSQAFPLTSPSILERKRCQKWLESSSTDFQSLEHLVHVLAGGCACYSWSLAPSQLEHHPVSLASLWQPREVCNHLLQRVKSPLISRVHSLDLRTR